MTRQVFAADGRSRLWRQRVGAEAVIHLGDDLTDENAFALSGPSCLTIRVGASRRTAASHHFRDQGEIDRLLGEVLLCRGAARREWAA